MMFEYSSRYLKTKDEWKSRYAVIFSGGAKVQITLWSKGEPSVSTIKKIKRKMTVDNLAYYQKLFMRKLK